MSTTCKKCENQGTVLLRKKDLYCQSCFLANIQHKFRACIGKNKILSVNENVLISLSGGPGSTALMDFIYNGVSLDNHKKLWITPIFLHIRGAKKEHDELLTAEAIREQCNQYNFTVHLADIFEYILIDDQKKDIEKSSEFIANLNNQFEDLVKCLPISAKNDFMLKVKRDLFLYYGKKFHCKYVFTGETSETLAINLLSNLANGRGSQVQHDIGFCDSRDKVKIVRPLRDISQEELKYYLKIKQLIPPSTYQITNENSIQAAIKHFVTDLQENFQATISTVCKTADKIGINDEVKQETRCKLCQSGIGEQGRTLSALEATDYSRTVSLGDLQHTTNRNSENYPNLSMFPRVNESFCYTCSRHFFEMNKSQLPAHFKKRFSILNGST